MRLVVAHPWLSALASLLVCAIAAVAGYGTGIEGLQAVTRYTGRAGLLWFALIFSISPLHRLAPGDFTRAALRSRRQLGLAFGTHHLVHLALLLSYFAAAGRELDPARASGGAAGYLALVVMMATSNDEALRRLGAKRWKRLHSSALWYLWIVFMMTYVPRLQGKVENVGGSMTEFAFCFSIVVAIAALRIASSFVSRRTKTYPQAV